MKKRNLKLNNNSYFECLINIVVFSFLGLIIEIFIGIINKIILKQDFALILGPACILYGFAFNLINYIINKFHINKINLFIFSGLLGFLFEYMVSFFIEALLGVKLWNMSNLKYQLNGRNAFYQIFLFGILYMIEIKISNLIKNGLNKISEKKIKIYSGIIFIVILINCLFTLWSIITYRNIIINKLNGINYTSNNNAIERIQNYLFSEKNMKIMYKNFEI